jgi:hypothetical protein
MEHGEQSVPPDKLSISPLNNQEQSGPLSNALANPVQPEACEAGHPQAAPPLSLGRFRGYNQQSIHSENFGTTSLLHTGTGAVRMLTVQHPW